MSCDGEPGARAAARFVFRGGKIVAWRSPYEDAPPATERPRWRGRQGVETVDRDKALFSLGVDPRDDLDVWLEAAAAELALRSSSTWYRPAELFISISIRTARSTPSMIDTRSMAAAETRVDRRAAALERNPRAPLRHVEGVGDPHDSGLQGERPPPSRWLVDRLEGDLGAAIRSAPAPSRPVRSSRRFGSAG